MIYFFDTSALAKRYVSEIGSTWVSNITSLKAGNTIFISELARTEFTSLGARKVREKIVSNGDFNKFRNDFLIHYQQQYQVIAMGKMIQRYAEQLLIKHPLRTLDAIQLASAIRISRITGVFPEFISADNRLLTIAAQAGFTIDNPNNHP